MTQDNRYVEGDPVVTQRVVSETYTTTAPPVYEAVEPERRHPGLIPLALSSLLGLLSLFLPFLRFTDHYVGTWGTGTAARTVDYAVNHTLNFWNFSNGLGSHHWFLLVLLLLALILALVAAFSAGAGWARSLAGVLGILSGLYLLWKGFTHGGLSGFNWLGGFNHFASGWGRWLMVLAGLALLATGIWSLLRGAANRAADAVDTVANTGYTN